MCKIIIEKLLYNREPGMGLCDDLEVSDGREKGASRGRVYIYN